ncbi:MAG: hypothetical protein FWF61_02045, partial [Brevinematales bacterium]|nr:hypothetical protein [Brevinematales bacterium]
MSIIVLKRLTPASSWLSKRISLPLAVMRPPSEPSIILRFPSLAPQIPDSSSLLSKAMVIPSSRYTPYFRFYNPLNKSVNRSNTRLVSS